MNQIELVNKFCAFEEEHNLFNEKIAGIPYWHLIRYNLYNLILKEKTGYVSTKIRETRFRNLKSYIENLIQSIKYNPFSEFKEVDLLIFNHARRELIEGKYVDKYTDYIINQISCDYLVFEKPYKGKHFRPPVTNNIVYLDLIILLAKIKKYTLGRFRVSGFQQEFKRIAIELSQKLGQEFQVLIPEEKIYKLVHSDFTDYLYLKKSLTKLIQKLKPSGILEVVYYDPHNLIINEIANSLGIKTIELQHGTMGEAHIAYNFLKIRDYDWFPDEIYVFSKLWQDNTRFPLPKDKITIAGFPALEKSYQHFQNISKNGESKKRILFLSQWTIGRELSQLALKLNRLLDKTRYEIIYKLHPGEFDNYKTNYSSLIKDGIRVTTNEKNVYEWFVESDYQVGVYSTAIYEGVRFNLGTAIYAVNNYKNMQPLLSGNVAELVHDENELHKFILNNTSHENDKNSNYVWQQDVDIASLIEERIN